MLCCYEDMKFPSNKERNILFSFFFPEFYIGLQHDERSLVLRLIEGDEDTFAVVWQGRRFINPDALFFAYLYTIYEAVY